MNLNLESTQNNGPCFKIRSKRHFLGYLVEVQESGKDLTILPATSGRDDGVMRRSAGQLTLGASNDDVGCSKHQESHLAAAMNKME